MKKTVSIILALVMVLSLGANLCFGYSIASKLRIVKGFCNFCFIFCRYFSFPKETMHSNSV